MKLKCFKRLVVLFLLFGLQTFAQDSGGLSKQKNKILSELRAINAKLSKLKKEGKQTQSELELLGQKISFREALIATYRQDIRLVARDIKSTQDSIQVIEKHVADIKSHFAELLQSFQIQQNSSNSWLYILNSSSISQAYKRFHYIKQYSEYRFQQIDRLKAQSQLLERQKLTLEASKKQKEQMEQERIRQNKSLLADKKELDNRLQSIGGKSKSLKAKMKQKQKEAKTIENEIRKAIARERKALKEAQALADAKNKTSSGTKKVVKAFADTPKGKLISGKFEDNKGRMPWPVSNGEIFHKFGKFHPKGLPNITIDVKGIEISTSINQKVRPVFEGQVSSVFIIPNGTQGIVVRHGAFVSIYANLKSVNVKKGQHVRPSTTLGLVATEDQAFGLLNFQIWREYKNSETNLNPALWLKSK
ncbi:MAG: murein hydrolase activator EnvC family protein [Flavobacteriales bacterium]